MSRARPRPAGRPRRPEADRTDRLPLSLRLHPGSNPGAWEGAGGLPSCRGCVAHCCRYVAIEIDRPRRRWQYDQIYWMLLHENVAVFRDHDGKWFAELASRCRALTSDNLCSIYDRRPDLCRRYEVETCPVWAPEGARPLRFESAEAFARHFEARGVRFREPVATAPTSRRPRRRTRDRARSGASDRGRARSPRR
jgi:Fe-S-cluster containining protein